MRDSESEKNENGPKAKQHVLVTLTAHPRHVDAVLATTEPQRSRDLFLKRREFFEGKQRGSGESTKVKLSQTSDNQCFPQSVNESLNEKLNIPPELRPTVDDTNQTVMSGKEDADKRAAEKCREKDESRVHLEELEDSIAKSTDNLLRQTLLAVKVLNMMPKPHKKRGSHSDIAAHSLLNETEMRKVLPFKEIVIHVATWNMNGKEPSQCPRCWLLPEELPEVPDIIVVGTQETYPEEDDWEIMLQRTIGPTHAMFHATTFGTLHSAIFVRRELIWFLSVADEDTHSVRMTTFRTKGAIAIAFYVFGTTFLFITSHLTAHKENLKERLQDIKHIARGVKLPHKLPCHHRDKDVTDNFDYVFWSGDLNFRLTRPRGEVLQWISTTEFPLAEPAPAWLDDQLILSMSDGNTLEGFKEGDLKFAPTYKFDPGTSTYDTSSKQRTPSYTDRILYKTNRVGPEAAIKCEGYGSVHSVCTSDHKPVWGRYKCPVQPGTDTIPLNAGLFNREVYLEAIKRSSASKK